MKRLGVAMLLFVAACEGTPRPRTANADLQPSSTPLAVPSSAPGPTPPTPPTPPPAPQVPSAPPIAPLVGTRATSSSVDVGASHAVEHGCATLGASRAITTSLGAVAAVGLPVGHAIAANVVGEGSESTLVFVTDENGRAARPVATLPISPPLGPSQITPPGLARVGDSRIALATIDASHRLVYRELDLRSGASTSATLAEGVADSRFPPSIAVLPSVRLIAFTKLGNPQRVEVVVVSSSGQFVRRHDVTPASAGAASPTFVRDVTPPTLVVVDPREALSLAHSVVFDENGMPGAEDSLQPIIGLSTPARIVAVRGARDIALLFLAHGESGGIGVYSLDAHASAITPHALVADARGPRPWVDALGASFGLITVSLAASATDPTTRDAVVRLVDSAGMGPELRIAATSGTTLYPTPSRDDAGHLAVIAGSASGITLTRIACAGH